MAQITINIPDGNLCGLCSQFEIYCNNYICRAFNKILGDFETQYSQDIIKCDACKIAGEHKRKGDTP